MHVETTDSTNTMLREWIARGTWPEGERYLRADYQTAGRGQHGNGWESEKGKNLLCSVLIKRHRVESRKSKVESIDAQNIFFLNVAVSVAVYRLVRGLVDEKMSGLTIKWPNDIYWGDKKLAGILIENTIIGGEVKYSIAGIGLNVNQTEWRSDAPNPVSLKELRREGVEELDLNALMERLADEVEHVLSEKPEEVWSEYRAHLYRREGYWPFVEREVSTAPTMNADSKAQGVFLARIKDILPTGEIVLEDRQGAQHTYHFKQIRYVL